MALRYQISSTFLQLTYLRHFLRRFSYPCCRCCEYISGLSDCCLKTQNEYYYADRTIYTASLFFRVAPPLVLPTQTHPCQSTAFCVEYCQKRAEMISLRKGLFLYFERRLVVMKMWSFLYFSLRLWGSLTRTLPTVPIIFMWHQIWDWDVLRSDANSRVLLYGLDSTNYHKPTWSTFNEHHNLR